MKEMVLNFWDSSEGSFLCSVAQRRCTTESNACSSGQSRQRDKRSSMFWERLDQRLKASTGCLRALWWETWSKIFAFQRVISSCCIFEIFLRRWGNGFNFILAPSMWCTPNAVVVSVRRTWISGRSLLCVVLLLLGPAPGSLAGGFLVAVAGRGPFCFTCFGWDFCRNGPFSFHSFHLHNGLRPN